MLHTFIRTPSAPTGPALVFLHYFGGSVHSWDAVLDQLATEFHCIAIDLPGFGESPALSDHQTVDEVADEVLSVLAAQLNSRPVILIGHSMGGKIGLALASGTLVSPPLTGLQGLILLAPSPPGQEPIPDSDRQDMLDQPGLSPDGQRKAAEKTVEKITCLPISKTVRQQIITDNLRSSPEAWTAWLTTGSLNDITDRMSRINVPVTILAGDQDKALPLSVQPDMVQPYLPQAGLHIIPGAGHLLPQEAPDQVVEAIRILCYQLQ
ncbi:alpha/beta fold hydrolase [uncultured Fibrella sp.]|uniref:alpha/beta fold hydrolase n=1 Tax=uncultured Fibrella sp. TaxID=1284596 RepID=UPI0035CC2FC5